MIKLNNKNITYVALADSNNSIKAPKEIWYADSNNSVKLVYRRKDALIEGEDYEKYHWLVGDGSVYIDTNHNVNEGLEYETKCILPENGTYLLWYRTDTPDPIMIVKNSLSSGDEGRVRISNISSIVRLTPLTDLEISTDGTSIEINGTSYTVTKKSLYDMSLRLFYAEIENRAMPEIQNNYTTNGVKCAYFRFKDTNSITIQDFIPCKLLKPVPKWLDANGIRRNIGECGMIDLVSGKFYGNVNSVGTFKAVNLAEGVDYEVHEWLIDNRIDGNYAYMYGIEYDLWNNHLQMMIGQSSRGSNRFFTYTDGNNCVLQMYRDNTTDKLNVVFRESSGTQHIADVSPYSEMPDGVEFDFYIENALSYCKKNGVIYTNNGNPTCTQSNWTSTQPTIYSARMGYIRELLPNNTYRSNLIPVKLLRSIPSKYDANGIARQAGECGMYDTVNDVFYGNVASSGSFTVSDDN